MSESGQTEKSSTRAHLVRFTPDSDSWADIPGRQLRAKSGCEQSQQAPCTVATIYSITSSATESSDGGTVSPIILAVSVLMTSSNLVDCTTGKSAGFTPLRMRPV